MDKEQLHRYISESLLTEFIGKLGNNSVFSRDSV